MAKAQNSRNVQLLALFTLKTLILDFHSLQNVIVHSQLKDRITPHVTNFFRLRLSIEKQEGKRKYKSDGAVMVGEFVCVCMFMYSE